MSTRASQSTAFGPYVRIAMAQPNVVDGVQYKLRLFSGTD